MAWFIMMSINFSDIAIKNIKGSLYCCVISGTRKQWGHKFNAKCRFDWKKWNIIKHKNLLSLLKMGKEILTFGDIEIAKNKF